MAQLGFEHSHICNCIFEHTKIIYIIPCVSAYAIASSLVVNCNSIFDKGSALNKNIKLFIVAYKY